MWIKLGRAVGILKKQYVFKHQMTKEIHIRNVYKKTAQMWIMWTT